VARKSIQLFSTEPALTLDDLARITQPVLVMAGDDDVVTLPHTVSLYQALPDSQLAVVPGASHALPLEQPSAVAAMILRFLSAEGKPRTMMPIRRT
jgi:pimeloyl-ACP methyl ester carboxylesterase